MKRSSHLFVVLVSAAIVSGCSRGSDYCDHVCDCSGCSDREYDYCVDDYDAEIDRADRRGCGPAYDDYAACVEDYRGCGGHYGCTYEWDRYQSCMK